MKAKISNTEEELEFVPVFVVGFDEELDKGIIMLTPIHEMMVEADPDFAVFAIDAAIDMLMQRRDKIEKRELH